MFGGASRAAPLIATRWDGVACAELGETLGELPPLERLLRCSHEPAFTEIAGALWEAGSDGEAVAALTALARSRVGEWEEAVRGAGGGGEEGGDDRVRGRRRGREDEVEG